MPGGDGTGPLGMGSMTGRAAGYCAGYGVPGFANFYGYGRGRGGWGRGRGGGRGMVQRAGRGMGGGMGRGRMADEPISNLPPQPTAPPQPEAAPELDALKAQAREVEAQLAALNDQIARIGQASG